MAAASGGAALPGPPPEREPAGAVEDLLTSTLAGTDVAALHREFQRQGSFLYLERFLPPPLIGQLRAAVAAAQSAVNRNYLPGHKQGGSVGRHALDQLAPGVGDLYRSPALLAWLGRVTGERLQFSPPDDPHAYALYFYTRAGDHIGWHYDTSYYHGRRFTLLLGVIDDSSCRLEYQLHTRGSPSAVTSGFVRYPPGGLVLFDGDKLRHRVTPLAAGETRVSLTFEYVTDPRMSAWWRVISNMKDAIAYFGLRQVFRRPAYRRPAHRRPAGLS